MNLRVLMSLAAVAGGLCWVARWGADLAGGDPGWGRGAHWAGLALLVAAVALAGAGLVSSSALWLRAIVAVAAPLLVWSVYAAVKGDREGILLDGVVGIVAVVLAVLTLLLGGSRPADERRRGHGAHSAR